MISVSAGAEYHPSSAYLLSISGGMLAAGAGTYIEKKLRVDDAVGAVAVRVCGFYGIFLVRDLQRQCRPVSTMSSRPSVAS